MPRSSRTIAMVTGAIALALVVLALAACSDGADTDGRLELNLGGGIPQGSVREAWLEFSGLTVERSDGTRVQRGFDDPRRIDLAELGADGSTALVREMELPAGRYEWIQLHLNTRGKEDTYLVLADDSIHELVIPSEGRNHLRIDTPFDVPPNGTAARTIDFHLHEPLGKKGPTSQTYTLRPILRSVATDTASRITATAPRSFIRQQCREPHRRGLALYVFAGEGVTPDDIDGATPDPVTVSAGRTAAETASFEFHAAFLAPGDYTIALTCHAHTDEAETDDGIGFFATTAVQTGSADTVEYHFGDPDLP